MEYNEIRNFLQIFVDDNPDGDQDKHQDNFVIYSTHIQLIVRIITNNMYKFFISRLQ